MEQSGVAAQAWWTSMPALPICSFTGDDADSGYTFPVDRSVTARLCTGLLPADRCGRRRLVSDSEDSDAVWKKAGSNIGEAGYTTNDATHYGK